MSNLNVKQHTHTIETALALMRCLVAKRRAPMLWGAPGIGKSDAVRQLARELGWKVIEFRTTIREPVDVRGIPVYDPVTKTTIWATPDELPRVERDGEFGFLFIDEINAGSPQMMAVMFQLVLDRRIGDYVLPPGWVVVAAGNRMGDKASAQRMPTALRNRFAHLYIEPDVKAWTNWATRNAVPPQLVAFMRLRPMHLHVMPVGDENAFPTPRSWAACADFIDAPKPLRMKLFASLVGDAYAAELDGFIDLYDSIGDLEDIIKSPKTAKLPSEPSLRFAICTGLARMATKKNFDAIVEYVKRLKHEESEMLVMHDATLRDPSLCNTKAFSASAVATQHLTIQ